MLKGMTKAPATATFQCRATPIDFSRLAMAWPDGTLRSPGALSLRDEAARMSPVQAKTAGVPEDQNVIHVQRIAGSMEEEHHLWSDESEHRGSKTGPVEECNRSPATVSSGEMENSSVAASEIDFL